MGGFLGAAAGDAMGGATETRTNDDIKEKFGDNVLVSLMGQYIPMGKAEDFEKLNRKITPREYNKVLYV